MLETDFGNIPLSERDKVYRWLIVMPTEQPIAIYEIIKPDNVEKFLTICKYFIRWDEGRKRKFYITFNSDYSKLQKYAYSNFALGIEEKEKSKQQFITDSMIEELETFFENAMLPTVIKLSEVETITDVKKFVAAHLATIKFNRGKTFLCYYDRLATIKKKLNYGNL